MQLHGFGDASSYARGCMCYLRLERIEGNVICCILAGKSLLAARASTIPRLELEAVLDAVKLEAVKRELKLGHCLVHTGLI